MSLKDECTFRYLNFILIGLCNSLADSWFDLVLLLAVPPEVLDLTNLHS